MSKGAGVQISFGASVPEHLPGEVDVMIPEFHELFRAMFRSRVFVVAAIRGQCLGGGLEVVTYCHRVVAHATATLGQPEIRLGVFAPVASVLLPERITRPHAEELLLTGRLVGGEEALRRLQAKGLVDSEIAASDERRRMITVTRKGRALKKSASTY